jgi:ATP-dependent HslUV protease ATP-binding subunit HslU
VTLEFTDDAVIRIAELAAQVNENTENIGARRLHTLLEQLLDDISYTAPERDGSKATIDAEYVDQQLKELAGNEDLSRYIL